MFLVNNQVRKLESRLEVALSRLGEKDTHIELLHSVICVEAVRTRKDQATHARALEFAARGHTLSRVDWQQSIESFFKAAQLELAVAAQVEGVAYTLLMLNAVEWFAEASSMDHAYETLVTLLKHEPLLPYIRSRVEAIREMCVALGCDKRYEAVATDLDTSAS